MRICAECAKASIFQLQTHAKPAKEPENSLQKIVKTVTKQGLDRDSKCANRPSTMSSYSPAEVWSSTELTIVRPDVTRAEIERLCAAAVERKCFGVCVNSSRALDAYHFGAEAGLKIVSTIGFPFGAADTDAKRYEVEAALDAGAHEIDAVMNIGFLKDGAHEKLLRESRDIVEAADERPVKILIDLSLITAEELKTACQIVLDSGAQFISVSADVDRIGELVQQLPKTFFLKAFAGKMAEAHRLLEAGARRIGQVAG
jgi:deoxyribose-phosphate aldolase